MNPTQVWMASSLIGVITLVVIGIANLKRLNGAWDLLHASKTEEEFTDARGIVAVARLNLNRDVVLLIVQAIFLLIGLSTLVPFPLGSVVVWGLVLGQVLLVLNSLIGFYRQGQIAKGKV